MSLSPSCQQLLAPVKGSRTLSLPNPLSPHAQPPPLPPLSTIIRSGRRLPVRLAGSWAGPCKARCCGRDRNPLRSRVYLACRDHTGRDIVPPAVYERFCDLASRCKRGGDCGQSVFVGLPSRWEARVALEAAGLATDNC